MQMLFTDSKIAGTAHNNIPTTSNWLILCVLNALLTSGTRGDKADFLRHATGQDACLQSLVKLRVRDDAFNDFLTFFVQGGDGQLMVIHPDPKLPYIEPFLLISKLPRVWPPHSPTTILGSKALELLVALHREGVPLLYSDRNRPYQGANTGGEHPIDDMLVSYLDYSTRGGTAIILTPSANLFMIEHENKHRMDHKDPGSKVTRLELELLNQSGSLSVKEVESVAKMISEQRAYHHEITKIEFALSEMGAEEMIWDTQVNPPCLRPLGSVAKDRKKHVIKLFNSNGIYSAPVSKLLGRLSIKDPIVYNRLKKLISAALEPNSFLNLETILPFHFDKNIAQRVMQEAERIGAQGQEFFSRSDIKEKREILEISGRWSKLKTLTPPYSIDDANELSWKVPAAIKETKEDIADFDKPINSTSLVNLRIGDPLTFNQTIQSGNLGSLTDFWNRLGLEKEFRGQFRTDEEYWRTPLSFWQLYSQFKSSKRDRAKVD